MSYDIAVVQGYLKKLEGVINFNLQAHVENRAELEKTIPEDHDLNEDGDLAIKFADDSDYAVNVPVWKLRLFEEAYSNGSLTDRTYLDTQCYSWIHLHPVSDRAYSLLSLEKWDVSKLAKFEAMVDEDTYFGFWIERGLTPFAFGLLKAGGLHKDGVPSYSLSDLILVISHDGRRKPLFIRQAADRYLFELAASSGIALRPEPYLEFVNSIDESKVGDLTFGEAYEKGSFAVHSIPTGRGSWELPSLWLRGKYTADAGSAIVAYTRVVEYVSSTASRHEGHTRLRLLLQTPDATAMGSEFLDRLIEEADTFNRVRRNDGELIKAAISVSCVPSVLADYLEPSQPRISKRLRSAKADDRDVGIMEFSEVLYSTRNSLVHGKANYEPTGHEVKDEDLAKFVPSAENAALMAIRWFLQQPDYVRVT